MYIHVLHHITNVDQMSMQVQNTCIYMCVIHVDGTANIEMHAAYTHTHTHTHVVGLTGGGEPARASHCRHRETCREDNGHFITHLKLNCACFSCIAHSSREM